MILSFKEFLLEASGYGPMSFTQLNKEASGGPLKGQWRTYILKQVLKNSKDVEDYKLKLKDGTDIDIDTNHPLVKELISLLTDEQPLKNQEEKLQDFFKKEKPFVTVNGEAYKLSDLAKAPVFGGGAGGKGGGAKDTERNESLQCVVCAVAVSLKKSISIEDMTEENIQDIFDNLDISLEHKDAADLASIFLNLDKSWSKSLIETANLLQEDSKNKLNFNDKTEFHRQSSWVKDLYALAKKLDKEGPKQFTGMDKWNPADIWAIKNSIKVPNETECPTILDLNDWLLEKFHDKDVVGISLKQVSNPHFSIKNLDEKLKEINNFDAIEFISSSKDNFFSAANSFIKIEGNEIADKIMFRSNQKNPHPISAELQATQSKARHGSVGLQIIQDQLTAVGLDKIKSVDEIKNMIDLSIPKSEKMERYKTIYNAIVDLIKIIQPSVNPSELEQKFLKNDNIQDGWIIAKYQSLEVISKLYKASPDEQREFIINLISRAASQSELSSIHVKVS